MTPARRFSARVLTVLGPDRATAYATLASVSPLLLGPVTALLVATRFTLDTQGYYYTFGSLIVMQSLAEVGLGQAIVQVASHEWAALHLDPQGRLAGPARPLHRLLELGRQSLKWYAVLGAGVILVLATGGAAILSRRAGPVVPWMGPWLALSLAVGLGLMVMPFFYLLQACNHVPEFWLYRWIQQIVNATALWLAIAWGATLWSPSLAAVAGLAWSISFIAFRHPWVWLNLRSGAASVSRQPDEREEDAVSWRNEVWPLQWRVGVAWLSTYATSQALVPLLFLAAGPATAGRMGLTMTLANVLIAVASAGVVTQAPRYGVLVAQRRFAELDRLFGRTLARCAGIASACALSLWIGVLLLNSMANPLRDRILPPLPTGLLLAGGVVSSLTIALSTYLRGHKREPLAFVFATAAIATVALGATLVSRWGATGVIAALVGVLALYQLPLAIAVTLRCRRTWHQVA